MICTLLSMYLTSHFSSFQIYILSSAQASKFTSNTADVTVTTYQHIITYLLDTRLSEYTAQNPSLHFIDVQDKIHAWKYGLITSMMEAR